jgi:DNA-binding response OmpR family regulator
MVRVDGGTEALNLAHLASIEGGDMEHQRTGEAASPATFGRRKVRGRVCIADRKQHIRAFLSGALEELGFSACECPQVGQLDVVLDEQVPDLVILGLSGDGVEAGEILETLAAREFDGKVLLLGSRDSLALSALEELGYTLGIAMLPTLSTPFGVGALRQRVAALLPNDSGAG